MPKEITARRLARFNTAKTATAAKATTNTNVVPMRRVSFNLPEPLFADIQNFAAERGDTMTGVLRWSLGLGKAIWDEVRAGHQIQVVTNAKDVLKELVVNPY